MAEAWINYWHLGKDRSLIKTEKAPQKDSLYVYETAERPSPEISDHTFFCPQSGKTIKLNATCDEDRIVRRREIVRELLTKQQIGTDKINGRKT